MKKQNIRRAAAVLAVLALAACLASAVFADLTNGYTPDGNAFPYDADGYDGRDMTGRSGTNDSGLTDRNGMNDNALPGRDGVNDNDVIDDDMGDMLPPDKTLGDTDGDGLVEGPYADDGMPGANARARSADANGSGDTADGDGGMADRIIGINLSSRSWSAEDTIDADIAANRNEYLTWMARTLSKVLMDKEPVDKSINRRHPAYGEFSVRIGRAIGDEEGVVKALGAAEANKAILPLLNDVVAKGILEILKDRNWEWIGTSGEMSELIIARQGDDGDDKTRDIYASRRVGKAFSRYKRQFATLFRMDEPRLDQGRTRYRFGGMTALGLQTVGLVDSEGGFPTSPCASANYQKPEINPPNPPNPPDAETTATRGAGAYQAPARARAPSPLPSEEEEGVMENGNEEFDWDL